jgi:antitoxin component of MazEF toxin-antitoxin module
MAVLTIRPKNQVTIPNDMLSAAHLRQGDPIEFSAISEGIVIRRFGYAQRRRSLLEFAQEVADSLPGLEEIDFAAPRVQAGESVAEF